ncbi:MAG: NmrA family NAD(P)-binding protein [Chloroflexi bacterium]|nr:NmrA family NAD(P)-binding protein [Chloroflexota bacterium]
MRILVTGAAGKTGQAVVGALAKRGTAVRALVRRHEQIEIVQDIGAVEVVVGDVLATAVWRQATQNIDTLYHICPNMHPQEVEIAEMGIAAAQRNGVSHFGYHSVLHPQTEAMSHHWCKLRVEEALFASGLPFTILQPAAYMQNILASWTAVVEDGLYRVPYPVSTPMSLVDLADVAEAAAIVLTQPGHSGAIYELVGPEILTQTQMAEIMGAVLEREVTAVSQPLAEWQNNAQQNGLPPYAIDTLLRMFRYYAQHGFWGNSNILRWLLNREPTMFAKFIKCWLQSAD